MVSLPCPILSLAVEMLLKAFVVNITIKSKIRYNGKEYSSLGDLPAEARAAYERAMRAGPNVAVARKIVINGQEFANQSDMPADQKKNYDDVMALLRDNGAVTLPGVRLAEHPTSGIS